MINLTSVVPMDLPSPTSLPELIADGFLIQSDVDATWASVMGTVTGIEYTPDTARVHTRSGVRDIPAREIARIDDDGWTWSQEHDLDIPELHGTHPADDDLLRAARTLHGNVPVHIASFPDGQRAMALDFRPTPGPLRSALSVGLAELPAGLDARRSLLACAASRGLGVRSSDEEFGFSDGTTVVFRDGRPSHLAGGLQMGDIVADAFYFSTEHQLLLDGRFPTPQVHVDVAAGRGIIDGRVPVGAVVIATVTDDTWTWAWADPHLPDSPAQTLRRFGIDHGILDLVRPRIPVHPDLVHVAKPILDMWTHAVIDLNEQTRGVVLLAAPELALPGPQAPTTRQAVEVTLAVVPPAGVDKQRARAAYAQRRGVTLPRTPGE